MLYLGLNNEGLNMLEVPYPYVVVNNQIVVLSTFRKLQLVYLLSSFSWQLSISVLCFKLNEMHRYSYRQVLKQNKGS